MVKESVELRAMAEALNWLPRNGFRNVEDVHHQGCGYDIRARRNGKIMHIEVKGSQKKRGIPDCDAREFNPETFTFKPHYLCIVRLNSSLRPKALELLTRAEINNTYKHGPLQRVRFNSTLKTDLFRERIGKRYSLK